MLVAVSANRGSCAYFTNYYQSSVFIVINKYKLLNINDSLSCKN